jgi:hypothetical protein
MASKKQLRRKRESIEAQIAERSGDLVCYTAKKSWASEVYDHLAQDTEGGRLTEVPSLEEIENAIDALGIPRADETEDREES